MNLETTYAAILGAKIKELRTNKGLSQHQVADNFGIVRSSWSRIESGLTAITVQQLDEICDLFGVDPVDVQQDVRQTIQKLSDAGVSVHRKTEQQVRNSKGKDKSRIGWAVLGGAALMAVIAAVLNNSKEESKDKPNEEDKA